MTTGEAKALAREWAAGRANELSDFASAFLVGSICRRRDHEAFPSTSDADVCFALSGDGHDMLTEIDGEYRVQALEYKGLDIETQYHSMETVLDHPAVLGSAGWAPAFRSGNVLLDPSGAVAAAQRAVLASYQKENWVRARCSDQEGFCRWGLDHAARLGTRLPGWADEFLERVVWLLFPGLAGAAGVPCVADLGGPTFRRALPNCRRVLEGYGMRDLYAKLLGILGGPRVTEERVTEFLAEMGRAFDLAVEYVRTRFWGGFFLQEFRRKKIFDGTRELVSEGSHREAMLFLAVMRTFAQNALENDAPPAVKSELRDGHRRLLSTLGIESEADIGRKAEELGKLLPEITAVAEEIIARNPAVQHGG